MSSQLRPSVLGATRIAVGTSTVIRVLPSEFDYVQSLRYLSGGSLEIVPIQLSGSSTAAGTSSWGVGYLLGTTERVDFSGPAAFYLSSSGATAVAQMIIGKTYGATIL